MMMDLYDQDRILKIHIESEKKIAAEEAAEKAAEKAEKDKESVICRMLKLGKLTAEEIALCEGVSVNKVLEIETAMLQEA
ncbi:MAG: hypothetical protein LUH20_12770 [Lachnospiraceae bacterium]|nr:hypothetical protein [Lachnospiraceae bacterium]MCD7832710.1 hypothetical protein [Lachnospiraceae bacterium]